MSLLMFDLQPERVVILTDTLITTDQGEPACFGPKIDVLPHADVALSCLGTAALHHRWADVTAHQMLWRSADDLARETPNILYELATCGDPGMAQPSVARIFGWSPAEDRFIGRSFDYRRGYLGAPITDGLQIHPPFFDNKGRPDPTDLGDWLVLDENHRPIVNTSGEPVTSSAPPVEEIDYVGLAVSRQLALESEFQAGTSHIRIGGHLVMTVLERGHVTSRRIAAFPLLETSWKQAVERNEAAQRADGRPLEEAASTPPARPLSRQQRRQQERQMAKAQR